MYDILIQNGKIVDGTGSPWFFGDIAVTGDTIGAVGHLTEAKANLVIDAENQVVSPGFVDPHTHLAFAGSREQEFVQKIQGATYMEILEAGGGINVTVLGRKAAE